MFGIILGLQSVLLKSIANIIEANRISNENIYSRNYYSNKYNINNISNTYFSDTGERDVVTNERVGRRINEHGDQILFFIKTKQDVRNISKLEREYKLKNEIENAKKNNKSVALKMTNSNVIKYYYTVPLTQNINEVYNVVDYSHCLKWNKKDNINNKNYIKGDRYLDLNTNEEYVIRKFYDKKKTNNNVTAFYLNIKNGHLVRRTDNQILNDNEFPDNNYIPIDKTWLFIKEFNEMQDKNKLILKDNEFYFNFWYNENALINGDVDIIKSQNENKIYKMQHFNV